LTCKRLGFGNVLFVLVLAVVAVQRTKRVLVCILWLDGTILMITKLLELDKASKGLFVDASRFVTLFDLLQLC
jgi:RNase P/RNase MRP subunit POP5